MNNITQNLYNNLMELSSDEESPFYHVDQLCPHDGKTYRVFSYRLGSYTDFLREDALECRGHMFLLGKKPELVSLPFPKFFNLGENPFTMDLDFSNDNVDYIATKEDGSLISSYLDYGMNVRYKSKTSLTSVMAEEAYRLASEMKNPDTGKTLHEHINILENKNYTVNMEYCSAKNRIVLPYTNCSLVVLGVRSREDFSFMTFDEMKEYGLSPFLVKNHLNEVLNFSTVENFVNSISDMKGIEGYVIRLKDGTMVKIKTDEYVSLHHAKDSITSPKRLMAVVLEEASDDLRQMFEDDEQALREIENMDIFVTHMVNRLLKASNSFYEAHKSLERKDYAIKGQQELERDQFNIAMGLYSGKEIDYKNFIMKNAKKYLEEYETTLDVVEEIEV